MGNLLNLQNHLPRPTKDKPLVQLEWIFKDKMAIYSNRSTKENYRSGLAFYKDFLKQTNNYSETFERDPRFLISRDWDVTALCKVYKWIEATSIEGTLGYRTSSDITGKMSALRQTMEHAYDHGYINSPVIDVIVPHAVRETLLHAAYSHEEYEALFRILEPMIGFSKGLLRPYEPTGKGRDPRSLNRRGRPSRMHGLGQGWKCLAKAANNKDYEPSDDNMRWYFENVMNCVAVPLTPKNRQKHPRFLHHAHNHHGGLNRLYKRWGVSSLIDQDVIIPLAVELIAETGLNVESLLSLRRNCFRDDHPLTRLPYLEYNKPRSGGEKELHLSLYDQTTGDSLGLKQKQSRIISNSIQCILKLTEPLVSKAPPQDREYLFLYQTSGTKNFGRTARVTTHTLHNWTQRVVRENDLKGQDGKFLVFNLSRFRPTKITEMVTQGYDFFDIMAIAGHSSITTTLSYIDKLKSATDFHRTIHRELSVIKNNKRDYERKPLPIATVESDRPGGFIFNGPLCGCKNPWDPPHSVKTSKGYHEGDACTYWNMCLQCENVLITEMNLPQLFAYRSEIQRALLNVGEIPRQGELYKKINMLLNEILTPDCLFSQATLNLAAERARNEVSFEEMGLLIHQSVG